MMINVLHTIDIVTDAAGDFSVATQDIDGAILQMRYVKAAANDLDANWDLTIAGTKTGLPIATIVNITAASQGWAPRQSTHAVDGTASLYAGAGEPVEAPIYIGGESLTVTVAQGGNVQSGTLYIWAGQP